MSKNSVDFKIGLGELNSTRKQLGIDAGFFSLSIEESIYQLLPTAKITINDIAGYVFETLACQVGNEIEILLEVAKTKYKNKFTFSHYAGSPSQGNDYTPTMKLSLIHNEINKQTLSSKAYSEKTISEILKEIFPDLTFNGSTDLIRKTWYQLNETNIDFIKRILKYSLFAESNNSPTALWIDQENKINFTSFSQLENQKKAMDFYLVASASTSDFSINLKNLTKIDDNSIQLLNKTGIEVYTINNKGEFSTEQFTNSDFPKIKETPDLKLLKGNSKDKVNTNILDMFADYKTSIIDRQLMEAERNNLKKDNYFLERFLFDIPTTKKTFDLKVGSTIIIHIKTPHNQIKESPYFYRNKFVIEKKITVWSKEAGSLHSYFIIARRSLKANKRFPVYDDLD